MSKPPLGYSRRPGDASAHHRISPDRSRAAMRAVDDLARELSVMLMRSLGKASDTLRASMVAQRGRSRSSSGSAEKQASSSSSAAARAEILCSILNADRPPPRVLAALGQAGEGTTGQARGASVSDDWAGSGRGGGEGGAGGSSSPDGRGRSAPCAGDGYQSGPAPAAPTAPRPSASDAAAAAQISPDDRDRQSAMTDEDGRRGHRRGVGASSPTDSDTDRDSTLGGHTPPPISGASEDDAAQDGADPAGRVHDSVQPVPSSHNAAGAPAPAPAVATPFTERWSSSVIQANEYVPVPDEIDGGNVRDPHSSSGPWSELCAAHEDVGLFTIIPCTSPATLHVASKEYYQAMKARNARNSAAAQGGSRGKAAADAALQRLKPELRAVVLKPGHIECAAWMAVEEPTTDRSADRAVQMSDPPHALGGASHLPPYVDVMVLAGRALETLTFGQIPACRHRVVAPREQVVRRSLVCKMRLPPEVLLHEGGPAGSQDGTRGNQLQIRQVLPPPMLLGP